MNKSRDQIDCSQDFNTAARSLIDKMWKFCNLRREPETYSVIMGRLSLTKPEDVVEAEAAEAKRNTA